jgi:antitoxin component YwqK of YwqJK toxin-antitoxin module
VKKLSLTLLTCLLFLSPNVVLSEDWKDLVERNGIFYKKFSDVPFSGKITGRQQGTYKNGKKEGAWVFYYGNGQVLAKGNFKNGNKDGAEVSYHDSGELESKGNFKNGKYEGAWIGYHKNGQLEVKGNFKVGEKEGAWVDYNKDGTIIKRLTGNFKNGKKISD